MKPWNVRVLCVLGLLSVAAAPASGQQAATALGTIVGQVLNADNREPVIGAQVAVIGTQLRALAAAEGRFVIRNVPAGTRTVRVQFIGFAPADQSVTVAAGETATVSFALRNLPYLVAPVVITALGIARNERSLGYAVQQSARKRSIAFRRRRSCRRSRVSQRA